MGEIAESQKLAQICLEDILQTLGGSHIDGQRLCALDRLRVGVDEVDRGHFCGPNGLPPEQD